MVPLDPKRLARDVARSLEERKRLRSRSPFPIAVADRFSQLNAQAWQAVTGGASLFHSAEYQRAFERVRPANIEPRYALIGDGDAPAAAVCMQVVEVDLRQVGKASSKLVEKLRGKVRQRLLVCGNLLVYGMHGVCFARGADRSALWPAVAEALYRVRRAEKLAGNADLVVIKDLDQVALAESAVLDKLSYGAVSTEPNMVLALEPSWRSHDDYLGSLASKYRSDVRNRVFKKFDEAGCALERLSDVGPHAAELHRLYLQVHGNATLRPFLLTEGYWSALAELGRGDVVFHVARERDRRLGFIVTVKDGDTALAYHVGFDREAAERGIPIYLRLLHASLAQAIAFGSRRVSFGRTALEPKARLGCRPDPAYVWARHRHPLFNQVVQPLLKLVDPDEAPDHDPFKAKPGTAS
jgi:hypothetical protein